MKHGSTTQFLVVSQLLPGYNVFRRDRTERIGGGVLIAVKADLHAIRRQDLARIEIELVVVELNNVTEQICNPIYVLSLP